MAYKKLLQNFCKTICKWFLLLLKTHIYQLPQEFLINTFIFALFTNIYQKIQWKPTSPLRQKDFNPSKNVFVVSMTDLDCCLIKYWKIPHKHDKILHKHDKILLDLMRLKSLVSYDLKKNEMSRNTEYEREREECTKSAM